MEAPQNLVMVVLWVLGGLGLFLYGIELMGESLRRAAGMALRKGLSRLTRTRFHGLVTGTVVTALLQSSSASTVMIVGFINAGLLTFRQSVSLILGANIGTTITPQITALDLDRFSLPILGIGFVMNFVCRRRVTRELGAAIMGFGMLFFGLLLMKQGVSAHGGTVKGWLQLHASGGLKAQALAFGIAVGVTVIIQSSAATIAMVQVLAMQGAVPDLASAIPMILGAQVGTCITAVLASLKSSLNAKRAALAHVLFNVLGVGITLALWQVYVRYIPQASRGLEHEIANCHLAIKLVNVALLLPLTYWYARFIVWITPFRDVLDPTPKHLDYAAMADPGVAIRNVLAEIRRVFGMCTEMLGDAVKAYLTRDERLEQLVKRREVIVDELTKAVVQYTVEISRRELPAGEATRPPLLLHIMSDVERIGDHAENIVEMSETYVELTPRFSAEGEAELRRFSEVVLEMGRLVAELLAEPSVDRAERVFKMKRDVNEAFDASVRLHGERLSRGECTVVAGIAYLDLMTNLRRCANHLRNIALSASGERPDLALRSQELAIEFPPEAREAETPPGDGDQSSSS